MTDRIMDILQSAKALAREYRSLTGKPLGVTGEVAEYEASRILNLDLTAARQAGYDAVEIRDGEKWTIQIKGRCMQPNTTSSARLGRIDIGKEWDSVLLVLMDECFDAFEIYEAMRADVIEALVTPGSKSRNERGALSISKFKSIGELRWQRP